MSAGAKGSFGLAASNNWLLRGTKTNDFIFFTGNSNQSVIFGCSNTSNIQLAIDSSGQLSVGKSNPSYALDVAGDINFDGILRKAGTPYISSQWSNIGNTVFITESNIAIGTSTAISGFTSAYDSTFQSNVTIFGQLTVSNVQYVTSNVTILNSQIVNSNITTLNTLTFSNQTGQVFLDSLNANLGIETSTPQYKLDVVGDINTSGVFRQNGSQIISSQWSSNNSNLYIISSNIGIGTSNPEAQLHISSNAKIDGNVNLGNVTIQATANSNIVVGITNIDAIEKRTRLTNTYSSSIVKNWTPYSNGPFGNWYGLVWSPELSIFVGIKSNGANDQIITSTNGITWINRTTPVTKFWRSVCWSRNLGLFVAVGIDATDNVILTSPDGINWTAINAPLSTNWQSICWSSELGIFVAPSSTVPQVMVSSDGSTWTLYSTPKTGFGVCWAAELGLFVAVGANSVMTSSNGTTWTERTPANSNTWRSVAWSPELYMFAAVSNTGTGDRVMTSKDGINWVARTSPADINWLSVCWSSQLSCFAAVSSTGTLNRVMTSQNGIDWNTQVTPDGFYTVIAWSPELSMFVALGIGSNFIITRPALPAPKSVPYVHPSLLGTSSNNKVSISTDLIPSSNITYDIGNSNIKFKGLYVDGVQCTNIEFVATNLSANTLSASPVHLFLYGTPTAYTGVDNITLVGTSLNQSVETRIILSSNTNLNWNPSYTSNCRLTIPYNGVYTISYTAGAPIGWQATFAISKNTDTPSFDANTLSYGTIPYITTGYAAACISSTAFLTTADYLSFHYMNASSTQLNMTANNTISISLLYRT